MIPTGNQLLNTPQLKVADKRLSQEPGGQCIFGDLKYLTFRQRFIISLFFLVFFFNPLQSFKYILFLTGRYRLPSDLENIIYPSGCEVLEGMELEVKANQVREKKKVKLMKEVKVEKEKKEAKKTKNVNEVTDVMDEKEANDVIKKVKDVKEIMVSNELMDVMDVKNIKEKTKEEEVNERKKEKEAKETKKVLDVTDMKKMKNAQKPQACDLDVVKREHTLKHASPR